MPGSINNAQAPEQQEGPQFSNFSRQVLKIMVSFLQASPNTQNKIQGKQLMSVTDVPTTELELFIGGSTKIIQVHYLSNTGQGQSQQTALVSPRRHKADSSSLP